MKVVKEVAAILAMSADLNINTFPNQKTPKIAYDNQEIIKEIKSILILFVGLGGNPHDVDNV